jgi:putative CocE/NonD family hydrolase
MRDGKRLFTSVYVPKDAAGGPYPFLMDRTPYSVGPYGEDEYPRQLGPSEEFQKAGYIFVYQDVRGRWMSEGTFVEMRPHIDEKKSPQDVDDASDTYDTIDFLLKHVPNNNGKVGIWGISYPGFYTSASIIDSHPALVAASPQAPMTDLFMGDDGYHGGAFMLAANFGFYAPFFHPQDGPQTPKPTVPFDYGTPDHYKFFLDAGNTGNLDKLYLKGSNWLFNDQLKHDTYDAYWKARDLSQHMKNVKCAVLVVGGWYDAEDLSGPYRTFYAINKFNPETPTTLVEGPWVHGGWARGDGNHLGDVQFNANTSAYFRANIQFPFFEHYLKGKGAAQPKAVVFETGTNVWRSYDTWPPKAATSKTLYFHAGGKLSFDPPAEAKSVDEYVSDPNHPVPFVGYTSDTVPQRYMVDDQRFASYRPDVLVYESDPLEEDVTIAGPISPKLKVASSGTDSDFDVKLIDVYPENYPDPDDSSDQWRAISGSRMRRPCTWEATSNCCAANRSAPSSAQAGRNPSRSLPARKPISTSPCPICCTPSAAAIALWSRCKAPGSRSPTAIRRRLPIFRLQNRKTSSPPPNRSSTRRTQPAAWKLWFCHRSKSLIVLREQEPTTSLPMALRYNERVAA